MKNILNKLANFRLWVFSPSILMGALSGIVGFISKEMTGQDLSWQLEGMFLKVLSIALLITAIALFLMEAAIKWFEKK